MKPTLNDFYLKQPEPTKSCLLALRDIILAVDPDVTNVLKYGMPFFCYKGKMFCYLWVHKKVLQPYLGLVEGKYFNEPELIFEKRSRMKTWLFDAGEDLPLEKLGAILTKAIGLCRSGQIKLK